MQIIVLFALCLPPIRRHHQRGTYHGPVPFGAKEAAQKEPCLKLPR